MTLVARHAHVAVIALAVVAVLVTACSSASSEPSPSTRAVATASAAPANASPTPTAKPTATPTATPTPTPKPPPATACAVQPETGLPPSDRLVNVVASTTADADLLMFLFGNDAIEGPGGPPSGELSAAEPPFTFGPSGLPIEMIGESVVQVVFRQMSLQADTGQPVYEGPPDLSPGYPALKHAVLYDESEGVIGWYVGYDGPGCVTLTRDGPNLILSFAHAG